MIDAGQGWLEPGTPTLTGTVRGVFRRALYVEVGDDLLAICDATAPPGPVHLRVRHLPVCGVGDRVTIADLDRATAWRPPPLPDLTRTRDLDLVGAARVLGGRGPGLTPAGDDVLAGILVVSALGPDPVDPAKRAAAAEAQATTAVARTFLRWAARGQSIGPVHDLLTALSGSDPAGVRRSLHRLLAIGATSGAALAYGIGLGLGPAQSWIRTTSTSSPSASVLLT
jgi:Protein of unknown function (DUF2877)